MLGLELGLQEFGISGEEKVDESIRESIMSVTVVQHRWVASEGTIINWEVTCFQGFPGLLLSSCQEEDCSAFW